jgi:hypothetical protein
LPHASGSSLTLRTCLTNTEGHPEPVSGATVPYASRVSSVRSCPLGQARGEVPRLCPARGDPLRFRKRTLIDHAASALNLARADSTLKASLKGKRKYAGWDNSFMATLMAG